VDAAPRWAKTGLAGRLRVCCLRLKIVHEVSPLVER
jgi:hypothetical protein